MNAALWSRQRSSSGEALPVHQGSSAAEMKPVSFFGQQGNRVDFSRLSDWSRDNAFLKWRPGRPDGSHSAKDIIERWQLTCFLRWAVMLDEPPYRIPFSIQRAGGENEPDFFVFQRNRAKHGLELSLATTPDRQIAVSQLAGYPGARRRSSSLPSGTSSEWVEIVSRALFRKIEKLRALYVKSIAQCDLLLFVDFDPPIGDLSKANQALRVAVFSHEMFQDGGKLFRRVFLVSEEWAIFDALGDPVCTTAY